MKLIVKYFFLADILLWRVILDFNTKFSLGRHAVWGVILGWSHLAFEKIWYLSKNLSL